MSKQPNFTPCLEWDCNQYATNHGRCSRHQRNWDGATRTQNLPKDWRMRRKQVLIRAKNKCYHCGQYATQVDHIINGDNHSFDNLGAICIDCHKEKSSWEGHRAKGHNVNMPMWVKEEIEKRGL